MEVLIDPIEEGIECGTPPEIHEKANEVSMNLLPEKSRAKYQLQYQIFMDWCNVKNVKKYSENVILAYLSELSQKYQSSTLWSIHSMLKSTLLVKNNVNIGHFTKVTAFLKKQSVGYFAKKSKIFNHRDIEKFLQTAPDEIYLMTKVVLIIGVAGACRTIELTNMTIDDVVNKDDILIIHVPDTKTHKRRTFTICKTEQRENVIDVVSICKRYFSLRPKNMNSQRLFVKYNAGKCSAQNVGHHTIGAIPSKIASYLKLPNSKEYTGHAFRRTCATLLADSGADILSLKRHGGWKSATVAEGYVEDSVENKITIAKKNLGSKHQPTSTITHSEDVSTSITIHHPLNEPGMSFEPEIVERSVITDDGFPTVVSNKNSSTLTSNITDHLQLSSLSKQGITFANCTIQSPIFNINIKNNTD